MAVRRRYIPALDGIRALAVAGVLLYHLGLGWAQGGMIGVTVFFVLSGYLITRLLIRERLTTGRIDLKGFWIRRIRRLMPLVVLVIVVTAALCTLFNHVMLTKMRGDILPSLLFFNNWWQILHQVSYFNAVGDPSPLTHFWSLAIEEQFYLVWPLLLLATMDTGVRRKTTRRATLALALASALAMALLYNPAADPSRVYYGTDTRAFSLLLGAWLAFFSDRELSAPAVLGRLAQAGTRVPVLGALLRALPAQVRRAPLDILGILGLAGLALMTVFTNGYSAFPYYGGTLLCSVLAVGLIAASTRPESPLTRMLSTRPLVWLGKRSYGIYLWHYPLFLLMNPSADVSDTPWWATILQIALVIAVSALSYRFVETPCRHGAIGHAWAALKAHKDALPAYAHSLPRMWAVPAAAALAVTLLALGGIAFVPETSALSAEGARLLQEGGADSGGQKPDEPAAKASKGNDGSDSDGFPKGAYDILMVGDSVSLRAVPYFEQTFPHGHIDALKNRQFTAGTEVYESYLNQNLAGKIAVFSLGTNGPITGDMVDALMKDAGDKRIVVFVNTRMPESWMNSVNQTLADAATRYPNVRVIDWAGYSAGRNDLFDGDGTHLSDKGAQEYVKLIYDNVKDDLPEHPEDKAANDGSQGTGTDSNGSSSSAQAR